MILPAIKMRFVCDEQNLDMLLKYIASIVEKHTDSEVITETDYLLSSDSLLHIHSLTD